MVKTFTDEFGRKWETNKLDFYLNENNYVVAYDGTYLVDVFYVPVDDLELTDEEWAKLQNGESI